MTEWRTRLRLRVRALLRRRQFEQDLEDEVAFHLAMREDQIRSSGNGHAHTGARLRFGSVSRIQEELRDTWALAPAVARLLRDFRYGARTLRRSLGFTAVVVLTLGLGIGANTAFFSVVNAVLIRPLGYANPERLVSLSETFPQARIDRLPFSALDFDDLRTYQRAFEAAAAYRSIPFELSGTERPERIAGAKVSANLFDVLGVGPTAGRGFSLSEDRPGVNVAILSWGLWQRRFGGESSVIGQSVMLDRRPYVVVGIMPAGFLFPRRGSEFIGEPADVWVPIAFTDRERIERGNMHINNVIGRLKPGVSVAAARTHLDAVGHQIAGNYPAEMRSAGFSPQLIAQPLREEVSGRFESPLIMLLAAVGLVLLVACANVANLILSRAATRQREFAVRTALGAGRAALVRLLLSEALLLSIAGGAIGIGIAYGAVRTAPSILARIIPGLGEVAIDVRVLGFTAVLCVLTALIFGLAPLTTLDRRTPDRALREGTLRTTAGPNRRRLEQAFVVMTVSLSCVLLVGAGLFVRSLSALMATDLGFRPANVVTATMTLPRTFYTTAASVHQFHETLVGTLNSLPGVRASAVATDLPLATYELRTFSAEGAPATPGSLTTTALTWVQGPYFQTLGMRAKAGRFFTEAEYARPPAVAIVNERFATLSWPGQEPIGKRVKWGPPDSPAPWLTVVGVISDVADGPPGTPPRVHAYEPFRQLPDFFLDGATTQFGRDVTVAVQVDGHPGAFADAIRQAISKVDRELAIEDLQSMDDRIIGIVAPRRAGTVLVAVFAAVALLLASVGLYGLLALMTAQRRREIAVRMALGAARHEVVRMVIGQGARLVGIGLVFGLLGAIGVSRSISSLLYRTNPMDSAIFAVASAVLAAVALVACALPAARAARVEPGTVLRTE